MSPMIQFIHINSYSRVLSKKAVHEKWIAKDVVAEATRQPGAISHIDSPEPPVHVYGQPIEQLLETLETWAAGTKDARGRNTRKDAVCLLAGVFSAPKGTSSEQWDQIKTDFITWATKKYGDRLKTVIEHMDEPHPHCHFYVIPLPGESFDTVHEGRAAVKAFIADGGDKKKSNKIYRDVMKGFQDEYYDAVGASNSMARIGPGRRRLSRSEWHLEQQQAVAIAEQKQKARRLLDESKETISQAINFKETAVMEAEEFKVKMVDKAIKEAQEIKSKTVSDAYENAKKIRAKAEQDSTKTHANAHDQGLLEFENSSIFGKFSLLKAKAVNERDELKSELSKKDSEISTLKQSLNNLKSDFDKYKIKARRWLDTARKFLNLEAEHEKSLSEIEFITIKNEGLRESSEENDELKRKLSLAEGRIQHLELTVEALSPLEPEPKVIKEKGRWPKNNEDDFFQSGPGI